ncbi:hypothetical protein MSAN_01792100 [Mycena sanguinolenta]|uniref:Peptidase C14 caspase domain-containing protein n=1 Tax=Mycena sanguinolenta TaxID=230812 RepID=A0A8H6XXW2_9AGAR|nr:hypothetical protein MSAN_01792100 [Mycena sanguinolenta]
MPQIHWPAKRLWGFSESQKELKRLAHLPWKNFHALLIGIDQYPRGVPSLGGAVRDIMDVKSFLVDAFDVPKRSSLDIRVLKNKMATHDDIIAEISNLRTAGTVKKNDAILIYYAGHGASMPPPEGWPGYGSTAPPEEVEIQCIVASDAAVSKENQKYFVSGVVLDRTLAALLRDLADEKGNNITVILDCCHSGSGTREHRLMRGIEFKDPEGRRITVPADYDRGIWKKFFGRGAVVDYQYRHAGLSSHVLLAACGSKEQAADDFSFTQALLEYLKTASLNALSYTALIRSIDPDSKRLSTWQNPICEGNSKNCILFDLKEINLGRLTFDVVKENGNLTVCAGDILGITRGTEFAVYSSKMFTINSTLLGTFVVTATGGTTSSLQCTEAAFKSVEQNSAVASPAAHCQSQFSVHVADESIRSCVEVAVVEENPEDQYGRPQLSHDASADNTDLILRCSGTDEISFFHPPLSEVGKLGLERLHYTLPLNPSRIRRVLRTAAHFFKYLRHVPQQSLLCSNVEVHLCELEETDRYEKGLTGIRREMRAKPRLNPGKFGELEVKAAKPKAAITTAPAYGIELVNKSGINLFAWAFFFDCSTLEIRQYYEPRVAKGTAMVDPTLPKQDGPEPCEPWPVALNFRNGGGDLLRLQLYDQQSLDVGFLRIFLSTRYLGGGLSSITQTSPFKYVDGLWRGEHKTTRLRGARSPDEQRDGDRLDIWDVITIPLVQRVSNPQS